MRRAIQVARLIRSSFLILTLAYVIGYFVGAWTFDGWTLLALVSLLFVAIDGVWIYEREVQR